MAGLAPEGVGAMEDKIVVGWVEEVKISPGNLVLRAKVDTGADNSSLNVSAYTLFERDTKPYVRFEVTDRGGKTTTLELPVVRTAKIKRHKGPRQLRPVVILSICLGTYRADAEVNLVDRSRFLYPMLIGRSFLRQAFVIDPSRELTAQPACRGDNKQ
jgi:hypothetical protein